MASSSSTMASSSSVGNMSASGASDDEQSELAEATRCLFVVDSGKIDKATELGKSASGGASEERKEPAVEMAPSTKTEDAENDQDQIVSMKKVSLCDLPEWLSLVRAYCAEMQKVQDDLCQRMQLNELLFENCETVRKTNLAGWEKLEESRDNLHETIRHVEEAIAQTAEEPDQDVVDPQDLNRALAMLRLEETKVDQEIQKFVQQNEKVLQDMIKIRANNTEISRVLETSWAKSNALTRSLNQVEQEMIKKHAKNREGNDEVSSAAIGTDSNSDADAGEDAAENHQDDQSRTAKDHNLQHPKVQKQYQRAMEQLQQIRSSNAKSSQNLQELFHRARGVRKDALANHAEMENIAVAGSTTQADHNNHGFDDDAEDVTEAQT